MGSKKDYIKERKHIPSTHNESVGIPLLFLSLEHIKEEKTNDRKIRPINYDFRPEIEFQSNENVLVNRDRETRT